MSFKSNADQGTDGPEEVLKAGALYRECDIVNPRMPSPTMTDAADAQLAKSVYLAGNDVDDDGGYTQATDLTATTAADGTQLQGHPEAASESEEAPQAPAFSLNFQPEVIDDEVDEQLSAPLSAISPHLTVSSGDVLTSTPDSAQTSSTQPSSRAVSLGKRPRSLSDTSDSSQDVPSVPSTRLIIKISPSAARLSSLQAKNGVISSSRFPCAQSEQGLNASDTQPEDPQEEYCWCRGPESGEMDGRPLKHPDMPRIIRPPELTFYKLSDGQVKDEWGLPSDVQVWSMACTIWEIAFSDVMLTYGSDDDNMLI
ncbi:hypothetical protein DFJ58DRAFT_728357 [Suillus subalutaceus]|uniref:uncharacterized protein n=1 Tax=Suillus subalutaceus TaxID=48586 RepID=UPI001B879C94|nr:uncharacterized protein DFJ58DRAFT_728357 [Suillus subalutaceus]KAG1852857.1 hypothetical protein DFJ58DRAFT_728357 [Suillus subalutaceus]